MKAAFLLGFVIMISSILLACSPVTIDDYQGREPAIDLQAFFAGDLVAYGIVRDRSGKVIRYFKAVLKGEWQESGIGTLDEVFWFDDGQRQTRLWTMTPSENGDYIGTAGDVEGSALIQTRGNAIRLSYKLRVPYNDSEIVVSMDDWVYQVVPGVVINETVMTKFGFEVGKVTLVIMKSGIVNDIPSLVKQFSGQ
ncbi:MAG: hypothetical protein ACJAUP_002424 [Cellvibrionaceae bacterium]|jgi:hypothetical protein